MIWTFWFTFDVIRKKYNAWNKRLISLIDSIKFMNIFYNRNLDS